MKLLSIALALICSCATTEGVVVGKRISPGGSYWQPTSTGLMLQHRPKTHWLVIEVKVKREVCVPRERYEEMNVGDAWAGR